MDDRPAYKAAEAAFSAALAVLRPTWTEHPDLTLAEVFKLLPTETANLVAALFSDANYWAIVDTETRSGTQAP